MEMTAAEEVFARLCAEPDFAVAVSRGELDEPGITDVERDALIHDAGLISAETSGFTTQFKMDQLGLSSGWVKPCPAHFWGSDVNEVRDDTARQPRL